MAIEQEDMSIYLPAMRAYVFITSSIPFHDRLQHIQAAHTQCKQ